MKLNNFLVFALLGLVLSCNSSGSSAVEAVITPKAIFITDTNTFDGNLGGVTGADALCMSDANYPGSGTYKALLVAATRSANPISNWVLYPNVEYYRLADDVVIGTTNDDSVFDMPLDASFGALNAYAGMGVMVNWTNAGGNCSNWTSAAPGSANASHLNQVGVNAIGGDGATTIGCELATSHLICVEQ
jgi:hypothetical protein